MSKGVRSTLFTHSISDVKNLYIDLVNSIDPTLLLLSSGKFFKDNLLKVRGENFAIDDEELLEVVRCIAAPIMNYSGRVVGAVSISGPAVRMSYEKLSQLKDPLINKYGRGDIKEAGKSRLRWNVGCGYGHAALDDPVNPRKSTML